MRSAPQIQPQATGNHASQDYQMQLMLCEQQNKKRLLMARQEGLLPTPAPPPPMGVENKSLSAFGQTNVPTSLSPPQNPPFGSPDDTDLVLRDFDGNAAGDGALENFDFDSFLHVPERECVIDLDSAVPDPSDVPSITHASTAAFGAAPAASRATRTWTFPAAPATSRSARDWKFEAASAEGASSSASRSARDWKFEAASAEGASSSASPSASTAAFGAASAASPSAAQPGFGSAPSAPPASTELPNPFGQARSNIFKPSLFNDKPPPTTPQETLSALIGLQSFQGYWLWNTLTFDTLRISQEGAEKARSEAGWEKTEWMTALVIAFFEERLSGDRGAWELVIEKAKGWLVYQLGGEGLVEEMLGKARSMV